MNFDSFEWALVGLNEEAGALSQRLNKTVKMAAASSEFSSLAIGELTGFIRIGNPDKGLELCNALREENKKIEVVLLELSELSTEMGRLAGEAKRTLGIR